MDGKPYRHFRPPQPQPTAHPPSRMAQQHRPTTLHGMAALTSGSSNNGRAQRTKREQRDLRELRNAARGRPCTMESTESSTQGGAVDGDGASGGRGSQLDEAGAASELEKVPWFASLA